MGQEWLAGHRPLQQCGTERCAPVGAEAILFAGVIWTRVLGVPPKELVGKVIVLQAAIHLVLGVLMGLSYEILA